MASGEDDHVAGGSGGPERQPSSPEPDQLRDADPTPSPDRWLRRPSGLAQRATLFGLAFAFYLLLGDPTAYDVVTGAVSAAVVTLLLARVAFAEPPTLRRTLPRAGRALLFGPYLLWAVVAANLALAVVLLDPRLPIDPSVETVETGADSGLERAVLANSVTLTPGTLAVDVREDALVVHTLTAGSRASLRDGRLQRAVRFVFAGRAAAARGDERPPSTESSGTGGEADG